MAFIRWRVLEALVAVDVANMPSTARADELTASTIPLLVYGALHAVPECLYSLIHFIGSFVTADFKGEHTSTRTNDNGQKGAFRAKSKQQDLSRQHRHPAARGDRQPLTGQPQPQLNFICDV